LSFGLQLFINQVFLKFHLWHFLAVDRERDTVLNIHEENKYTPPHNKIH
jgi:hypothetical protein